MRLHAEREARTAQALADEQQLAAGRARVEELRAAQEEAAAAGARASASAGDGRQEAELSEQSKALQAGLIEAARRLDVVTEQLRSQTDALHRTLASKASQESERAQLLKTVAALEAAAEAAAAAGAAHAEDSEKKEKKRLRRTRSEEIFLLSNVEARARVYAIEAASAADEALQQQLKEQEGRAVTALAGILLEHGALSY